MFFGAIGVPESPRWLVLRNRPDEAADAMKQAQGYSSEEAMKLVSDMTAATFNAAAKSTGNDISTAEPSPIDNIRNLFATSGSRKALVIGVGLVLFQQFTGQPSVLYFANRIFADAGLGFEAAIAVGVFKLVMTLVSAQLVEDPKWGRRQLLLYGNAGVAATLAGLSILYATAGPDGPNQAAVICMIFAYVGSYQIGFGPMTWLILSEIFPLKIRSAAVGLGTLTNFASNFLVALIFEAERVSMGEAALFAQFAVVGLAALFFTQKFVFETSGLSLEEIETKLNNNE